MIILLMYRIYVTLPHINPIDKFHRKKNRIHEYEKLTSSNLCSICEIDFN